MDRFGENLYNLYGSTEVAWATIATPEDLRAAPGTAGRPPRGTVVKLYDDDGDAGRAEGATGRIFVGNELAFEGYTGGGSKDAIGGLLSSGDVGHFDDGGRLFVDGRDDDMIVSGGENVFPGEVEDLLAGHDAIVEAAVFGVDDEQFGQRLRAVVVLRAGREAERRRGQALRQGEPRRIQGPARRRVRRRAAPDVDRQGAQAGAQGRLTRSYAGGMPQRTDVFDLAHLGLTSGEGRRLELHVGIDPFSFGGQEYAAGAELIPVRLDVSRTTGNGWALRLRFAVELEGPCMRCLDPATPRVRGRRASRSSSPGAATRS